MSACALLLLAWQAPVPGPPIAVEALQKIPTEGHVFSQSDVALTLRVFGAQGRRLDLSVQPYQLASALAAPVGAPREVAARVELGPSAWHEFPFVLACPKVDQRVRWELHFLARLDGEETWQKVGQSRLELYPPDLMVSVRALAQDQQWFVSDERGTVAAFLRREAIPFIDIDRPSGREAWARRRREATPPSSPPLLLCVADKRCSRAELGEASCALVIEPASIALSLRGDRRARVTLDEDLIGGLGIDPRAQTAFIEAVELARKGFDLGGCFGMPEKKERP